MSKIAEKYGIVLTSDHKTGCPRCIRNGKDNSRNNLHVYGATESAYCWSCGWTIPSQAYRESMGWDEGYEYDEERDKEVMTKEKITKEEVEKIKGYTNTKGHDLRGISDATNKDYHVRFKYDENTGDVCEVFYPFTEGGKATGYKVRSTPEKDFRMIGRVGKDSDLFGQWKWKKGGGKKVLITAGELDCLSAYQMLKEYTDSKGYDPIPVVSSGIGESGSYKQLQVHYDWLNTFDLIIVCYDNDDAGRKAVEKVSDVLPKGKMRVMNLPHKDSNVMLEKGHNRKFVSAFYDASPYTPTGVVGSSQLFDAIVTEADIEKLEFPPFMSDLNELTAGGVSLGTIGAISASTGIGKSSIVNECIYHWIFNSPHRMGVVSMEQNKGQYGELMLSRHMKVKLGRMKPLEKREFLKTEAAKTAARELFYNELGEDRWMIVDDRDGDTEALKEAIEKLIIACDCKVIVIDTISDMFDGLSIDEQAVLMKWQKSIVNRYNVAIINIAHQRKEPAGGKDGSQGKMGNESSMQGTSTLMKSCAWIIMLARDKLSEDPIIRNTTLVQLPKNRGAGDTGNAGAFYYDAEAHTMHELEAWKEENVDSNY